MGQVRAQVRPRLELDAERVRTPQQGGQQLDGGLHPALGPPPLLHEQRVRRAGQLGRNAHVVAQREAPAPHLRPVADVQVLGERVRAPAPGVLERFATPQSSRAVEVEEAPTARPTALLDEKVAVQQDRLGAGQPGIVLVEVVPPGLRHAHAAIRHLREQVGEERRRGREVGVQNENELAGRGLETSGEGAGLEAVATVAVDHGDVDAAAAPRARAAAGQRRRLVGRIVQDLDLQAVERVIERARRVDRALDDPRLVEGRDLDRHARGRAGERPARALRGAPPRQRQEVQAMERQREQQRQSPAVERERGDGDPRLHGGGRKGGRDERAPRAGGGPVTSSGSTRADDPGGWRWPPRSRS